MMDISRMQDLKYDLTKEIAKKINDFCLETELEVDGIELTPARSIGNPIRYIVNIEVKLK